MDKFIIKGQKPLRGSIKISGSKNAALPIMASTLCVPAIYILDNIPNLKDTQTMIQLLEIIGCKADYDIKSKKLIVDSTNCKNPIAPYELVKTMRASFYVLGPLVSRFGYAEVSMPGGCAWGPRPIDFHLKGLEKMGVKVTLKDGNIIAEGKPKGANISLEKTSVGATGNLIMASVQSSGITTIDNAAMEPEIIALGEFLNQMGCNITGLGTQKVTVEGQNKFKKEIKYRNIPDRIEAGTFLIAGAANNSSIKVCDLNVSHLNFLITKLRDVGAKIKLGTNSIQLKSSNIVNPINIVTDAYPGYPTDLQAQWIALMLSCEGVSTVRDEIYHDRFTHIAELSRMGANIQLENNTAIIKGVKSLNSAKVMSTDIRASASLIIAALKAEGETEISRIYHIDRGYERIEDKFSDLGADIKRVI